MEANHPAAQNLTLEQNMLIDSIKAHAKDFVKRYGYDKLADEMKLAKLDGAVLKIFSELYGEAKTKTQKKTSTFSEKMEQAQARVKAQDEQKSSHESSQKSSYADLLQKRKRGGDER